MVRWRIVGLVLALLATTQPIASQQIWDIWQTTYDESSLFEHKNLNGPINFGNQGPSAQAHIELYDSNVRQEMDGFGSTLTDASAQLMFTLKTNKPDDYWTLLNTLFNPTDGFNGAGMTVLRVPIGSTDFSTKVYTFDDVQDDYTFAKFTLDAAPEYFWTVLKDIKSVNPIIKLFYVPWSAPAWMKTSHNLKGGGLKPEHFANYTNYLLRTIQEVDKLGLRPYSLTFQNEPEFSTPTLPSMSLIVTDEAKLGLLMRPLLDSHGFKDVKLIGYDHNWDDIGTYGVQLMDLAGDAFSGVSVHCYIGELWQQEEFTSKYPDKELYFTECTGTFPSDFWGDIKWNMDTLFVGSTVRAARTVMLWNLALDPNGGPKLAGASSCDNCRGLVTIDSAGTSYTLNQEYFVIAHNSRAMIPRDVGGPFGRRIELNVDGSESWALTATAYVTGRVNPQDWLRYTVVVANKMDESGDPRSLWTTFSFRGKQADVELPVGLTTFWFYAPANNNDQRLRVAGTKRHSLRALIS